MRPQQKKSHPHRILPPALHRQQLRVVLRRGLEAEARAMRESEEMCRKKTFSEWLDETEDRVLEALLPVMRATTFVLGVIIILLWGLAIFISLVSGNPIFY
ncbi:hypothetical protein [uncultured Desulfovibrio sp.]|uniref:hypothetical protein n=1 Tax=uncultured Desulfovibrio sp. TaxID=167968 RepID=UPI0025D13978|nr:hypothetical protein [uncultured Desulfovibrio sp.]